MTAPEIERVNISIHRDCRAAIEAEAAKHKQTFSAFIVQAATDKLPAAARKKLPQLRKRGRPRKEA